MCGGGSLVVVLDVDVDKAASSWPSNDALEWRHLTDGVGRAPLGAT
jgi:hypothetical protein